MTEEEYTEWAVKYPFMSGIRVGDQDIIGIIQNSNKTIISMYCYELLTTSEHKRKFIEQGETWWWESNRAMPINIFLHREMQIFKYALRSFSTKGSDLVFGSSTCIHDVIKKRIKRRQITLVRRLD